jgi:phage shock protein PspC (stress-responsive transcriptional regulator)
VKHLYRCRHDRRIAGVAGGVAEFFDLDPTLVRLVWFVSMFFGALTLVLYVGMAIIVPLEPETAPGAMASTAPVASFAGVASGHRHAGGSGRWMTYFGIVLVLFGTLALLDVTIPAFSWRLLGPVFVAGIGAILIAGSLRSSGSPVAPTTPGPGSASAPIGDAPAPGETTDTTTETTSA